MYSIAGGFNILHALRRPWQRHHCTFFSCSLYKTGRVRQRELSIYRAHVTLAMHLVKQTSVFMCRCTYNMV